MHIVTNRSELANLAFRQRRVIYTGPAASANEVWPVSNVTVEFEKAFFYGVRSLSIGAPPVPNVGSAFLMDGTGIDNGFIDELSNDPRSPIIVTAAPGTKLDLNYFAVLFTTPGDCVYVKYQ